MAASGTTPEHLPLFVIGRTREGHWLFGTYEHYRQAYAVADGESRRALKALNYALLYGAVDVQPL